MSGRAGGSLRDGGAPWSRGVLKSSRVHRAVSSGAGRPHPRQGLLVAAGNLSTHFIAVFLENQLCLPFPFFFQKIFMLCHFYVYVCPCTHTYAI